MDTEDKYLNDPLLEVELAKNLPEDSNRRTHPLNNDVPIDGHVHILFRRSDEPDSGRDKDGRWYAGSFPFRDHRSDEYLWAAYPDKPNGRNHPVWKWQNPDEDPHENITLNPSIGLGKGESKGWRLHCWIKNGEIDFI